MAEFTICPALIDRDAHDTLPKVPGVGPLHDPAFDSNIQYYQNRQRAESTKEMQEFPRVGEAAPLIFTDSSSSLHGDCCEHRVHTVPEVEDDRITFAHVRTFFTSNLNEWLEERRVWNIYQWFSYYVPFLAVMRSYNVKEWLLRDVVAGLAVAAMVVPQSMSYAKLAGLPSTFGLNGAFVPVIIYALFGTSRQLGVGPVAVTSLMLGSGIPEIVGFPSASDPNNPSLKDKDHQDLYNATAIQVAFIAGILYTSVGVLNLGFILNLLSHSVLAGFMTGASLIIGLSQTKYLFGYSSRTYQVPTNVTSVVNGTTFVKLSYSNKTDSFPRHDPVHLQLGDLFSADWTPYFRWQEFIMGLSWIAILFAIKYLSQWKKKLSLIRAFGPIIIVILSTLITGLGHLDTSSAKIKVVGTIPSGLPKIQPPSTFTTFPNIGAQITLAIIICIVDMIESMSIARALAASHNYEIEPTRELRGLGIANIVGSIFGCYTTTGSFSRSAVNNECGAASQLAGMITGFIVMFVLLWLTPLFSKMPNNVMGSIVIFAVIGLFKFDEFFHLWKVNKFDWLVFTLAALTVMFLGVETGLEISIAVSIALVLFKSAFPRISVLGKLPGTNIYRNVALYRDATQIENGLIIRVDAPLFFGNVAPIRDKISKMERDYLLSGNDLKWVLIDLSATPEMDASSMHFLKDWVLDHKKRGIQLVFSDPTDASIRMMEKTGIAKLLGKEWIHVSVHDAVNFCRQHLNTSIPLSDSAYTADVMQGVEEETVWHAAVVPHADPSFC